MMIIVEQSVECELERETKLLGKTLPQRHFVHQKFHMGSNRGRSCEKLATDGPSYDTASCEI
jgi:hypothetical protein